MAGQETDQDIARFKQLTAQINQLMNNKFQESETQRNELNKKVQTMEAHRAEVLNALSGGIPMASLPNIVGSGTNLPNPINNNNIPQSSNLSNPGKGLTGEVTNDVIAPAVKDVLQHSYEMNMANQNVAKYSTKFQIFIAQGKDYTNYLFPFRGFGPSSEGGDVILGEQLKIKGLPAALLQQQLTMDNVHLNFIIDFLEYGENPQGTPPEGITASMLQGGLISTNNSASWDVKARETKYKALLALAVDNDPAIQGIIQDVHKYNKRSHGAMLASKIIEPALAGASMIPMFIGPIARGALANFIYSSGGQEEDKLIKEIYLDKRFESRVQTLSEELHLSLDSYRISAITNNLSLQAAAEAVMEHLVPAERLPEILS
jgi:hypothetical protein